MMNQFRNQMQTRAQPQAQNQNRMQNRMPSKPLQLAQPTLPQMYTPETTFSAQLPTLSAPIPTAPTSTEVSPELWAGPSTYTLPTAPIISDYMPAPIPSNNIGYPTGPETTTAQLPTLSAPIPSNNIGYPTGPEVTTAQLPTLPGQPGGPIGLNLPPQPQMNMREQQAAYMRGMPRFQPGMPRQQMMQQREQYMQQSPLRQFMNQQMQAYRQRFAPQAPRLSQQPMMNNPWGP